MRRTELKRRTPLQAKTPLRRTAAPKKKARSKAETLRVYGTPEFKAYLHASPCLWCGRMTGIEAAHLRGNGGVGRKDSWTSTGPLCGVQYPYVGCHARWDRACAEKLWLTDVQRTSILLRLDAFHAAWQSHLNGERK